MSSADIAKESTKGSLILFIGNLASTAISAVNAIAVARLLGPDSYGVYTLALVVPTILVLFTGLGVNSAVTRYTAYYLARGEVGRAVTIARRATIFMTMFGVGLAIFDYFGAPYFSSAVFHRNDLSPLIQLVSVFIIGQTLAISSTSAFVGWSSMTEVSGFSTLQAILKLAISPTLILVGFGIFGALVGHVVSFLVQGAGATILLYLSRLRANESEKVGFLQDLRTLLAYGLPIFAGVMFAGLAAQYLTIILAAISANSVVGYYSAGQNVLSAISVLSVAMGTVLFRSFSALNGLKEDVGHAFDYAVRYVSYVLTPVVFFLIAAAGAFFSLLYSPFYSPGIVLLQLLALANLPVAFGMTVIPSYLNGVGRSRITMLIYIVGAAILVVAAPLLGISLRLGAEGIIYALLASNVGSTALGLVVSKRSLNAHVEFKPLGGIIAACVAAAASVLLIPANPRPSVFTLALDGIVFSSVYLTAAPILGAISDADATRLVAATREIRYVGSVLRMIMNYERYVLHLAVGRRAGSNPEVTE